jgi:beta-fructofuranosidase
MYRLADRWIWDFWLARDGDDHHLFYLQAPRSLGSPDLRHRAATIGHAVSADLRSWTPLQEALAPGATGAFDDLATWTGSVVRADDGWMLFYTGVSRADDLRVQRVGAARSQDLVSWERVDGFVLEADGRWYETLSVGDEEVWRDPWVCRDPQTGGYHLFLTAHANQGPAGGRGVIGHAWSDDLHSWTIGPPVSSPGEFVHLEVPQVEWIGGRYRLFFSTPEWGHSPTRLARPGVSRQSGTHYLVADDLLGPYRLEKDGFLLGDEAGRHYAARVAETPDGWMMLAWLEHDQDGSFLGELSDPMPLSVETDGTLRVDVDESGRTK